MKNTGWLEAPRRLCRFCGKARRAAWPTPKANDPSLARTANRLIGVQPDRAGGGGARGAGARADARLVTDRLGGDAEAAAAMIVEKAREAQSACAPGHPACLLFGGETAAHAA